MENLKKAVETVLSKNAVDFKDAIHTELASRLHAAISTRKESVASGSVAANEEVSEPVETNEETIEEAKGELVWKHSKDGKYQVVRYLGNQKFSRPIKTFNSRKEALKYIDSKEGKKEGWNEEAEVSEANVLAPSAPATGAKAGIPGADRANFGAGEVPDPLDADLQSELESAFGLKAAEAGKATAKDDDISLDPNFEKEFYMKETEYKGHKVLLKQVGLGLSKPVRVYVDNKRWEFFAGPEAAIRGAKSYIDGMDSDLAKEQAEIEGETISEKVDLDGRTKMVKHTMARLEQARKLREGNKKISESPSKFNGLYNDGSGKGAIVPEPIEIKNKPAQVAEKIVGQKNTTAEEVEAPMSPREMIAAVNMKGGQYQIKEEELSAKQKKYRAFFDKALKKHNVSSPTDFKSDAEKKKFFDYVKSNWKG